MACELTTIQTEACTSGIGKLTDKLQLLQIIAQLQCEISETAPVGTCENLEGVASPLNVVTPDFIGQVYTQSDGTIWQAGSLLSSSWTVICEPIGGGLIYGPLADPDVVDQLDGSAFTLAMQTMFGMPSLYSTDYSFGTQEVTNNLVWSGDVEVTSLEFRRLSSAGGVTTIAGNTVLVSILFPVLTSGNSIDFDANPALTSVSIPLLASTTGDFAIFDNDVLTSISAPSLTAVGGDVTTSESDLLDSISMPLLATIGGIFNGLNNAALASVVFPSLVSIGGNLDFSGDTILASFSAPNWLPTDGTTITFFGDALDATSVNHILARCVAAAVTACTIDLSGGTNAAPTGQGIIDSAALTLAGNTVTTN